MRGGQGLRKNPRRAFRSATLGSPQTKQGSRYQNPCQSLLYLSHAGLSVTSERLSNTAFSCERRLNEGARAARTNGPPLVSCNALLCDMLATMTPLGGAPAPYGRTGATHVPPNQEKRRSKRSDGEGQKRRSVYDILPGRHPFEGSAGGRQPYHQNGCQREYRSGKEKEPPKPPKPVAQVSEPCEDQSEYRDRDPEGHTAHGSVPRDCACSHNTEISSEGRAIRSPSRTSSAASHCYPARSNLIRCANAVPAISAPEESSAARKDTGMARY